MNSTTGGNIRTTAPIFARAQELFQQGKYQEACSLYTRILQIRPDHPDATHFLGLASIRSGHANRGLELMHRSLVLKPDDAMYRNNMGLTLQESGDGETAEKCFREALRIDPAYADAHFNLGRLLAYQERYAEARDHFIEVLAHHVQDVDAQANLAQADLRLGHAETSLMNYRRLVEENPDRHDLRLMYAGALRHHGFHDLAERELRALIGNSPVEDLARLSLATLSESRNRLDEAEHWLREILNRHPSEPAARILQARLLRRKSDLSGSLAVLKEIDPEKLLPEIRAEYFHELGMVLDQSNRYSEAFAAFSRFNSCHRIHRNFFYNASSQQQKIKRLRSFFTRPQIAQLAKWRPPDDQNQPEPIFIVGFPRSGTTLVEQIVSSHPNISAGGELVGMEVLEATCANRLQSGRPYPECLAVLAEEKNHGKLSEFRAFYLGNARALGVPLDGTRRFTDKMPLNEMRLGLINLVFPRSPVIHVVRHPLDACLSAYFNYLTHGGACAFDLTAAATHYQLAIEVAEHYVDALELKYLRVRYEDIVAEPEGEIRRMLAFLDEPWDERCLSFHQQARIARTASYAQVNQALYTSSRYRYLHYLDQLKPIIKLLTPVIERLGYRIDAPDKND